MSAADEKHDMMAAARRCTTTERNRKLLVFSSRGLFSDFYPIQIVEIKKNSSQKPELIFCVNDDLFHPGVKLVWCVLKAFFRCDRK